MTKSKKIVKNNINTSFKLRRSLEIYSNNQKASVKLVKHKEFKKL